MFTAHAVELCTVILGYVDWRESWRSPNDPAKWMRVSVVWYSQQVMQSMGMERFAGYAKQFGYGNADVGGDAENDGLTRSGIGSSLKISPLQQVPDRNRPC